MNWENWEIRDEGLRFRFIFIKKTIPWSAIKRIRVLPFWKACFLSFTRFTISTTSWDLGGVTCVETQNCLIVFAPRDRDSFVDLIQSHLK